MATTPPNPPAARVALAHGIDLVDVARIAEMLERHDERFLDRVYTQRERDHALRASTNPRTRVVHLAGRFAAKEAVMKALGTGWGQGVGFTDIEVVASASGAPVVVLSAAAEAHARAMGIAAWLLSISHTDTHAMASAIGLGAMGAMGAPNAPTS
jgi:holo-[acyl-carrier protein] synthase